MKKKIILIIEDEDELAAVTKLNLEETGKYSVIIMANGRDGLCCIKNEAPDLVLLDLMLPGLQGEAICRDIKINPKTKDIPIIMVTAKVSDTDKVLGRVLGADSYLSKPVDIKDLLLEIEKFI